MFCIGFAQYFSTAIVPAYLYYSHIPVSVISLVLGFLILRFGEKKKSSLVLVSLTLSFFFLFVSNIFLWLAVSSDIQTFVWFLNQFVFLLLPILSFYLFLEFTKKNETFSIFLKILILILSAVFIPVVFFGYNIDYFDLYNCTVVEANLIVLYQNAVLVASCLAMAYLSIKNLFSVFETKESKIKSILLAIGLCCVLFSLFFTWNPLIFGYSDGVEQFGFVGAIVFLSIITYMIVRFNAFSIKLIATQALVWGLVALIGSQFFFIKVKINFILNGIGFISSIILGGYLIMSVKKEIKLRENLQVANERQVSLIHFITHQVKGFLTKSRSIFSVIREDEESLSDDVKKMVDEGFNSDTAAVDMVQQILKASNIQSGSIIYNKENFNLKDLIFEEVEKLKTVAVGKGLDFKFSVSDGDYLLSGDKEQISHVLHNLLDNSIKYTLRGSVDVFLEKKGGKNVIRIVDTGVGISKEDFPRLFTEGGRGKDSVKVNTDSTGYGLFIVKGIVEAHSGRVWAESAGPGKGATFTVEI